MSQETRRKVLQVLRRWLSLAEDPRGGFREHPSRVAVGERNPPNSELAVSQGPIDHSNGSQWVRTSSPQPREGQRGKESVPTCDKGELNVSCPCETRDFSGSPCQLPSRAGMLDTCSTRSQVPDTFGVPWQVPSEVCCIGLTVLTQAQAPAIAPISSLNRWGPDTSG